MAQRSYVLYLDNPIRPSPSSAREVFLLAIKDSAGAIVEIPWPDGMSATSALDLWAEERVEENKEADSKEG